MDVYEAISDEIDIMIVEARKQKLKPEETRKEIFKVMSDRFAELNQIEMFTSPLLTQ